MTEKDTGRSEGYGFFSYENAESAQAAILQVNGK
jgi:RNA recognition motif-containing protein